MEEKEDEDPSWFNFIILVFRFLFAILLLGIIVLSYFFPQKFQINWFIIIVCWTLLCYLLFDKIIEFSIGPSGLRIKRKTNEAWSEEEKREVENKIENRVKPSIKSDKVALAMYDLKNLLTNYSFFYGHWDQYGMSDVIRFSDAWSGRLLRYINHFADDIKNYLINYSDVLKEPLKKAVEELGRYVDETKQFHKGGELLSHRAFSREKFLSLIRSIVDNFKQENFVEKN